MTQAMQTGARPYSVYIYLPRKVSVCPRLHLYTLLLIKHEGEWRPSCRLYSFYYYYFLVSTKIISGVISEFGKTEQSVNNSYFTHHAAVQLSQGFSVFLPSELFGMGFYILQMERCNEVSQRASQGERS